MMFQFAPPTILTGDARRTFPGGRPVVRPMTANTAALAARIGGKVNLLRRGPFAAASFARMLAKIAHAFTVGRPRTGASMEDRIRAALATGTGIRKVARQLGIGTSTIQRVAAELRAGA